MIFAGPVTFDIPPWLVAVVLLIALVVLLAATVPAGLPLALAARSKGRPAAGAHLGGTVVWFATAVVGGTLLRGSGLHPGFGLVLLAYVPSWLLAYRSSARP